MTPSLLQVIFKEQDKALRQNNAMFALSGGNQADVERQLAVLNSEVNELEASYQSKNLILFLDGLGDVTYVLGSLWIMHNNELPERAEVYRAVNALLYATRSIGEFDTSSEIKTLLTECTEVAMVNNLTKFDVSIEDATKTQAKYEALGIETTVLQLEPEMYVVKSSITDEALDVVEGKVLKSVIRHTKPDFSVVDVPKSLLIPDPIV